MDRDKAKKIQSDALLVLQTVAKMHGVSVGPKRGNIDGKSVILNFEFAEIENGRAVTREAQDFVRYAESYGFKPEDLGKTFPRMGELWRITGLSPKSRRFPILAENVVTGKVMKFTEDVMKKVA